MKRVLTALVLVAILAGSAGAAEPARVLAVEWEAGGGKLRWVSATTLRPTGSTSVNLGGAPANLLTLSPDRTQAALGGGTGGRLRLVDLRRLRSAALMRLGGYAVSGATWPARDRIVAVTSGDQTEVVVLNPLTRRVLSRRPLAGTSYGVVRAGARLVTLLAPSSNAIGQTRLAVVEPDGDVRTLALPGVNSGFAPAPEPEGTGRHVSPGLAVSPDGTRAAVAVLDAMVVVDLGTLETRVRRLVTRTPARVEKRIEGWGRSALWVGDDLVAVAGWSDSWEGERHLRSKTGVRLVTLASGETRLLDETAFGAELVGNTLLTYGGSALRGHTLDGKLKFELLAGRDTGYIQIAGRYAYVGSGNSTRFAVVDVTAGRIIGNARTAKPTVLLGL